MTKWHVVRISEVNYQRIIKNAKFGDSFDEALGKLLNLVDNITSKHGDKK